MLAFSVLFATQAVGQPSDSAATPPENETSSQSDLGLMSSPGFTAETLLQQDVAGQDGEPIGEVINFEIGDDNAIQRVLINSDGFLGIDETVIAVPYEAIDLTVDEDGIRASIEEDDTDAYSIFGPAEGSSTSASNFRVSLLLGDNVLLKGGDEFGYLADLAFDLEGRLQAVIVRPDISFDADGYYAFAFERSDVAGQAFDPSAASYTLSLDRDAVLEEEAFDYDAYQKESVLMSPAMEKDPEASSQ
ncbi:PRC-barrel domain-containing protein [Aurantimonas sp. A2-1-M11]|uniref:PRC-barrel domain-containing protein n=1 Tax=Aurantimonas sp. A2-1-M11 TaxID=3113712 RepID=UPI002F947A69